MRILYLSLRCPYPPQRGDRIRSYHFNYITELMPKKLELDLHYVATRSFFRDIGG